MVSKNPILKTGLVEVETVIDKDSGEVLETNIKKHTYMANTKEEFLMCYSALLGVFMNMTQAEIRIYGYLLRYARGVKFDISKKIRIDIAKQVTLNERTILNTLPSLLDKKVIYQYPSGLYQINPRYAFQGSTGDRNNALKAIIELGCLDC